MEEAFEKIRRIDESGSEYWLARELATAIGYKDFRDFKALIEKAQKLCVENNARIEDHFAEATEMRTGTFVSATGGTFVSATGGTFVSAMSGTFVSATGGTFNPF